MKILVVNGPNINMLGVREPEIYGRDTYADLCEKVEDYAAEKGVEAELFQSNHEGEIIDKIQEAYGKCDGIIINAGGYTHTSIAIPDALRAVGIPCVEVHISDINSREEYRKVSYIKDVAVASVVGHGIRGYLEAIDILTGK